MTKLSDLVPPAPARDMAPSQPIRGGQCFITKEERNRISRYRKVLLCPIASATLHHIENDFEYAANFLADLVGAYTVLFRRFNHLVSQVDGRGWIIVGDVQKVFCHPFVQEENAAIAHERIDA